MPWFFKDKVGTQKDYKSISVMFGHVIKWKCGVLMKILFDCGLRFVDQISKVDAKNLIEIG